MGSCSLQLGLCLSDNHVNNKPPLDSEDLQAFEAALRNGVKEFHHRNVYHGDIASRNMMWENRRLTIVDFASSSCAQTPDEKRRDEANDLGDMDNVLEEMGVEVDRSFHCNPLVFHYFLFYFNPQIYLLRRSITSRSVTSTYKGTIGTSITGF